MPPSTTRPQRAPQQQAPPPQQQPRVESPETPSRPLPAEWHQRASSPRGDGGWPAGGTARAAEAQKRRLQRRERRPLERPLQPQREEEEAAQKRSQEEEARQQQAEVEAARPQRQRPAAGEAEDCAPRQSWQSRAQTARAPDPRAEQEQQWVPECGWPRLRSGWLR